MKPVDEEQELTRLLAQETSPLASSLAALRDHGPDAAELASLASRLALQGLDVSASKPPPARANPWKKWGWSGLGGASAVLVWLALRAPSPLPDRAPVVASVVALPTESASVVRAEPAAVAKRAASVARDATLLGEAPTAAGEAPLPTAANAAAAASTVSPSALGEQAKGAASSTSPGGDVQGSVKGASHPGAASARAGVESSAVRDASGSAPASTGSVAAPTEMELLRDARFALRPSPARALELTDEHGRLYPHGKLTQERELIAVSALVALGRRAAALSRAANFERQYPTSPYRKQMGDLLR